MYCGAQLPPDRQCDGGFGPVSLPCFGAASGPEMAESYSCRKQGQRNPSHPASEMQAWLYHLQGDFSKGESHFTGAERSVVSF